MPEPEPQREQERLSLRREAFAFIWETVKIVIVSLAIILPVRYFLVQPFFVKGASMEPAFEDGNYILIDEISYRLKDPARGDIVVFKYPIDPSQFFIKRIIGMPGETVKIRNNKVRVFNQEFPDGFILNEGSYLHQGQQTLGDFEEKLAADEYYVLGDNRLRSSDSRFWGPVKRPMITGRVFFRAFPINEIGGFKKVEYQMPIN